MKIIQRMNKGDQTHDYLLSVKERFPNSFTDVWLAVPSGFPKKEKHREIADGLAVLAERYREKGVKVSLQVANTVGHGIGCAHNDHSGVIFDGSPVNPVVDYNGKATEYSFCWNNEYLRSYLCEHLEYYAAKIKPSEIWFDDDMHNAKEDVVFGCFCPNCVEKFNRIHGTDYTPDALGREFAYGDLKIREAYVRFVEDSLGEFAEVLSAAIHKGCPETAVGLQSGTRNYSINPILDGIYRGTGIAPTYRAGVGVYRDHNPNLFFMKLQNVSLQHSTIPDYVICRCPEIDNLPSNSMGKSMYGTALETTLHFASGSTGISHALFSAIYELHEAPEFYDRGFEMFERLRPYWDRLAAVSEKTVSGGMTCLAPAKPYLKKFSENDEIKSFGNICFNEMPELLRDGIPVDFEGRENGAYILHPNVASSMEDDELRALLKKNVLTDTETVMHLKSRGIDIGVSAYKCSTRDCVTFTESFTDHPAAKRQTRDVTCSYFYHRVLDHYNITSLPERSEVVSTFRFEDIKSPVTDIDGAPYGCASAIVTTHEGGRWAIVGYGLWRGNITTARRDFILDLADYISDDSLAARTPGAYQNYLMPRVSKANGRTLAVSYLNCTVEPQTDIALVIRRPESENFILSRQFEADIPLSFTKNGDEYTVRIPKLPAWDIATVFCDVMTPKGDKNA